MDVEEIRVLPGGGLVKTLPDGTFHPLGYIRRYPTLFHNTSEEGAAAIIRTGVMFARPIWNFNEEDVEEYRHGLVAIRDGLLALVADLAGFMPDFPNFTLLKEFGVDVVAVASQCIEFIAEEVEALSHGRPNLHVYVACFSTKRGDPFLAGKFGRIQLEMNPLLPVVAYAHPIKAHGAALSRVSYLADELVSHACHLLTVGPRFEGIRKLMEATDPARRVWSIAVRMATDLMVLAPNLKRAEYAKECEWRLKVCFHDLPEQHKPKHHHENRLKLGLPGEASYSAHSPARLLQPITVDQRTIINGVKRINADGQAVRLAALDELRLRHCMRQTNYRDAEMIASAKGLTSGTTRP